MGRSWSRRFGAAALVAACLVPPLRADAAVPFRVNGWVPYWGATDGRASYGADSQAFEDVSPFFATANIDGEIGMFNTSSLTQTIVDAKSKGLTVLPSITDGTGNQMATLLGTRGWPGHHVAAIVDWVLQYGTDGADLDYEGFAFTDNNGVDKATVQQRWVAFVQALSDALHAQGKLLSVTIPPQWSTGGYPVYAMGTLAPYVDRIRLMVYDWSVASPGPIAPLSWVRDVIATTNALVADRTKVQLGIPAYGRNWARQVNSGELCPTGSLATKSVVTEAAPGLAAAHGATPVRDPAGSGEMTFGWTETVTGILQLPVTPPAYTPAPPAGLPINGGVGGDFQPAQRLGTSGQTVTCTIRHTVFYPDGQAAAVRAQLAKDNGWRGAIVWALGYEDAAYRAALYATAG